MTPEEIEADVAAIDTWIDNYEDVAERKARLCLNRAWEHYGLDSWDALCRERGWNRPLTLEQRQQEVAALRQQGMSTRAIAAAVGASQPTVRRDLAATESNVSVDEVVSLDGRTRPATRPTPPASYLEDCGGCGNCLACETVAGDDYVSALDRYPELNVPGAESGDVVRIAAMIDARPEHEHRMRADAGSKWLRAKVEGRLDETPIVNETEAAERIYKSAYLLLKDVERYGDGLPDAMLHADPVSRDIWQRTLQRLAVSAADLAKSIPAATLRSVQ